MYSQVNLATFAPMAYLSKPFIKPIVKLMKSTMAKRIALAVKAPATRFYLIKMA